MNMTPEELKITRVGTLWFPLVMVVSMIVFVAMSAWIASREKSRIDSKFEALTNTVQNLTTSVDRILNKIGTPDGSSISKQEWLIECLQLQAFNPGWYCPYAARRLGLISPSIGDWKAVAER